MQVNANALAEFARFSNFLWGAPIEIAISLSMLWFYIGNAIFVALGALVVLMPINTLSARYFSKAQEKKLLLSDSRIKILNEILNGIKVIKVGQKNN